MRTLCLLLISACALTAPLQAQDMAVLGGTVLDPKNAVVPGAKVKLTDAERNITLEAVSSPSGDFGFGFLIPGTYAVEVSKEGFSALRLERVELRARDRQNLTLKLTAGAAGSAVNVTEAMAGAQGDIGAGSAVDQAYIAHLPVNGRSVDSLMRMVPASVSGAGAGGVFNVNGLRASLNYYTLDGVNFNGVTGPAVSGVGGAQRGAGIPLPGIAGSLQNGADLATETVSLDLLAEVRVQSSTFSAEFGRTPAAQVALVSRSGSNRLHGSLYEYYRGSNFNANSWFANSVGLGRGDMKQNQFGGTVGGPLLKDRTFFFASYEALRLKAPETAIAIVPDLNSRRTASAALRPFLEAFPVANGPAFSGGTAQFASVFTNPLDSDTISVRLDQAFGSSHKAFARYFNAPSDSTNRSAQYLAPNVLTASRYRFSGATGGLTSTLNPNTVNDLHLNYTTASVSAQSSMDSFGGATPLRDSQVFPAGVTSANADFVLSTFGASSYAFGPGTRTRQWQANLSDALTMTAGSSTYKLGVDVLLMNPTYERPAYSVTSLFNGVSSLKDGKQIDGAMLSGKALASMVGTNTDKVYPTYRNLSMYVNDTVRLGPGTTLNFGLRWDLSPAPSVRSGAKPYALSSAFSGRLTQSEPLYDTRWTNIAPRFGLSQSIRSTPGKELILRFGLGAFHDMNYGTNVSFYTGAPFSSVRTLTLPVFPLVRDNLAPPALSSAKPLGLVGSVDRFLRTPMVYQWNVTLERYFGREQSVSAAYVGTRGRKLMLTSNTYYGGTDYEILRLTGNGSDSDYHGLQMQYQRRLSRRLQTQFAWTWSHSIDTSTEDPGLGLGTVYGGERGNSNFDVRHNINWSGSYLIPSPQAPVVSAILRDWNLDWIATYRTGLPFDVTSLTPTASNSDETTVRGLFAQVRPDYNGAENWTSDASAPGGQRVNAGAFTPTLGFYQGNLGRNALHGFSATQVDFSFRRQIPVTEAFRLNFGVQAFNVFNMPSFLNPVRDVGGTLANPKFGQATQVFGAASGGGAGSYYRAGGPRSLQFSLRLQF